MDDFEVDETCVHKRDWGDDTVFRGRSMLRGRGDPQSLFLEHRALERRVVGSGCEKGSARHIATQ